MDEFVKRLLVLLLLIPNLAYAQITEQQVLNAISSNLPTNNANQISALLLRNTLDLMTSAIFGGAPIQSTTICPPPTGLGQYQLVANISGAPTGTTLNIFDGTNCVPFMTLNQTAHTAGALYNGPSVFNNTINVNSSITATRYFQGANNSPNSFVDLEPNTFPTGYTVTTSPFFFDDETMAGQSFSDAVTHTAFTIFGNKSVSVAVPNGAGTYIAQTVNQNCQGMGNGFCLGGLTESTAVYNPIGQNFGSYFGGNSQIVVPVSSLSCPAGTPANCGPMSIQVGASYEFDTFLYQNVDQKVGIRIVDLGGSAGNYNDVNNSYGIRLAKSGSGVAGAATGWPYGISIDGDYVAGFADARYPVQAGGVLFISHTTSLQVGAIADFTGMNGGCSVFCWGLPANNPGVWFGAAGAGGKINSGTTTGAGSITFNNGNTTFTGTVITPNLTVTTTFTATGLVTNADLVNASTTVNTITCTLGSSCTVTAAAGTLTGTTLNSAVVTSSLTSVGTLTSLTSSGNITSTNHTFTAAAPTVAAAQVGLGSTTVAAGSPCPTGTVGGVSVTGCWVINVAGTTRYIPYF